MYSTEKKSCSKVRAPVRKYNPGNWEKLVEPTYKFSTRTDSGQHEQTEEQAETDYQAVLWRA